MPIFDEGFPVCSNFNVVTVEKKGVNSFEDILGDHVLSVDLEKEDCGIVKITGVESVIDAHRFGW